MPLINHPDGGKLLRTATGLAGHTACCCDQCPDCDWLRNCFIGLEAHIRIQDVTNGTFEGACEDCDEFNITFIVELVDTAFCGAEGDEQYDTEFTCGVAGAIVLVGLETPTSGGGVQPMVMVNVGLTGLGGGGAYFEDIGCSVLEDLCAGIEVEIPILGAPFTNDGVCTWSAARCFLQLLPP